MHSGTRLQRQSPIDSRVGARIRLRRMTLGMSQEQLGAAIGVAFQQVQKYERGANRVSAGRLYDLAHALGVGVAYFFAEAEADPAGPAASGDGADTTSRETLELLRAYYSIQDPQIRHRLQEFTKALAAACAENAGAAGEPLLEGEIAAVDR